jgi:hypothetical protein
MHAREVLYQEVSSLLYGWCAVAVGSCAYAGNADELGELFDAFINSIVYALE